MNVFNDATKPFQPAKQKIDSAIPVPKARDGGPPVSKHERPAPLNDYKAEEEARERILRESAANARRRLFNQMNQKKDYSTAPTTYFPAPIEQRLGKFSVDASKTADALRADRAGRFTGVSLARTVMAAQQTNNALKSLRTPNAGEPGPIPGEWPNTASDAQPRSQNRSIAGTSSSGQHSANHNQSGVQLHMPLAGSGPTNPHFANPLLNRL